MFRRKWSLLLFLLPGFALLLLFNIVPFFTGIQYSLTDGTNANQYVGFKNYEALWQNRMFLLGLKNTMLGTGLHFCLNSSVYSAERNAFPFCFSYALSGSFVGNAAHLVSDIRLRRADQSRAASLWSRKDLMAGKRSLAVSHRPDVRMEKLWLLYGDLSGGPPDCSRFSI